MLTFSKLLATSLCNPEKKDCDLVTLKFIFFASHLVSLSKRKKRERQLVLVNERKKR